MKEKSMQIAVPASENRILTKEEQALANGRIPGVFAKYAVPGVIGLLFIGLQAVIDGMMIGNFVGAEALASVSIVMPCYNFMTAVAIVISIGCMSIISIKLGEGRRDLANNALKSATITLFCFSVISALLIYIYAPVIVKLLGANESLAEGSIAYIRTMIPFFPVISVFFLTDTALKSMGRPFWAMSVMSTTVIANIILDLLFVAVWGWGIKGAALSTGIAFSIGVTANLPHLLSGRNLLNLREGHFNRKMTGNMIYNGSSEGISEMSAGISTMLFNIVIMQYLGSTGVAAFTALQYVMFIGITIFLGISDGVLPVIGYNHGAGNITRIKETLGLAIRTNLIIGVLMFLMVSLFGEKLISLFFSTNDSQIIEIAVQGSAIYAFAFLINGFNILSASYFTALGDAKLSIIISLLRGLIFISAGIWALPHILGISGIWLAMPIAEVLTLGFAIYLVRSSVKKMQNDQTIVKATDKKAA